jgi:hypothetical protein
LNHYALHLGDPVYLFEFELEVVTFFFPSISLFFL